MALEGQDFRPAPQVHLRHAVRAHAHAGHAAGANVLDSSSVRAAAGVGVTWTSPIGPISLDFGQALLKENYDQTEAMRVNFGTRF